MRLSVRSNFCGDRRSKHAEPKGFLPKSGKKGMQDIGFRSVTVCFCRRLFQNEGRRRAYLTHSTEKDSPQKASCVLRGLGLSREFFAFRRKNCSLSCVRILPEAGFKIRDNGLAHGGRQFWGEKDKAPVGNSDGILPCLRCYLFRGDIGSAVFRAVSLQFHPENG